MSIYTFEECVCCGFLNKSGNLFNLYELNSILKAYR